MRYFSICSGIEAATEAWHPLGFTAVGYAEIDKFASAVLAERFGSNMPGEKLATNGVPNHGDFTAIDLADIPTPVDLLVGGTPCQAFSFAGKRLSLADARGNLTLAYAVLAHELARSHGLKNALWENVPGVLSTDDNAFGCFLGALVGADDAVPLPQGVERWPDAGMVAGPRARAAWRLLDAQYFGLAQRRERVFVVVDFGTGADPAAVLFEPQGVSGNSAPSRETGERPAPTLSARTKGGGGLGTDFDCDGGLVAGSLGTRSAAFGGNNTQGPIDVATAQRAKGDTGHGDFESETFIAFSCKDSGADASDNIAPTLRAMGHDESHANAGGQLAVAFNNTGQGWWDRAEQAATVRKGDDAGGGVARESTIIAHTLRGEGFDASEDGTGRGIPLLPIAFDTYNQTVSGDVAQTLCSRGDTPGGNGHLVPAVAYDMRGREGGAQFEGPHHTVNLRAANGGSSRSYVLAKDESRAIAFATSSLDSPRDDGSTPPLKANMNGQGTGSGPSVFAAIQSGTGWAVRRLTTVECARLQGFPDHHARIPWRGKPAEECPDGPQYKTYGNSMAVKCMAWLGERLQRFQPAITEAAE